MRKLAAVAIAVAALVGCGPPPPPIPPSLPPISYNDPPWVVPIPVCAHTLVPGWRWLVRANRSGVWGWEWLSTTGAWFPGAGVVALQGGQTMTVESGLDWRVRLAPAGTDKFEQASDVVRTRPTTPCPDY